METMKKKYPNMSRQQLKKKREAMAYFTDDISDAIETVRQETKGETASLQSALNKLKKLV